MLRHTLFGELTWLLVGIPGHRDAPGFDCLFCLILTRLLLIFVAIEKNLVRSFGLFKPTL